MPARPISSIKPRLQHGLWCAVAVALLTGCVTPRGAMPFAPREDELVNDGSAAQQEELRRRFKVRNDRWGVHVGDATRNRARIEGPLPTEWMAVHPEVATYLEADPEVSKALPNRWLTAAAFGGVAAAGILALAGVVAVVTGGFFTVGFLLGGQPFRLPGLNNLSGQAYVGAGSALSLGTGVGVALLAWLLVVPCLAGGVGGLWWSWQKLDGAVEVFNRNLETRIQKNARQPEVRDVQAPAKR